MYARARIDLPFFRVWWSGSLNTSFHRRFIRVSFAFHRRFRLRRFLPGIPAFRFICVSFPFHGRFICVSRQSQLFEQSPRRRLAPSPALRIVIGGMNSPLVSPVERVENGCFSVKFLAGTHKALDEFPDCLSRNRNPPAVIAHLLQGPFFGCRYGLNVGRHFSRESVSIDRARQTRQGLQKQSYQAPGRSTPASLCGTLGR